MASRFITTSFVLVSTAALLGGCDTVSGWFGGKESSGSSGTSYSSSTGSGAYDQHPGANQNYSNQNSNAATNTYASGGYDSQATANSRMSSQSEMAAPDTVKHAQQALKDEGLYKGRIDGVVGPQTRDAVAQYQRDHKLQQTSMLDDQTLRSLDSRTSSSR
ncbi:MAG: peptidoglycan-binding protein [Alphaproteobacteria bacterium]|nr:peptidoglycan-binding protein [Alphaproteobacteria bacterium]